MKQFYYVIQLFFFYFSRKIGNLWKLVLQRLKFIIANNKYLTKNVWSIKLLSKNYLYLLSLSEMILHRKLRIAASLTVSPVSWFLVDGLICQIERSYTCSPIIQEWCSGMREVETMTEWRRERQRKRERKRERERERDSVCKKGGSLLLESCWDGGPTARETLRPCDQNQCTWYGGSPDACTQYLRAVSRTFTTLPLTRFPGIFRWLYTVRESEIRLRREWQTAKLVS